MENKINIIIPAKNEVAGLGKFLPTLVDSFPDTEIIIIDDGSNDGTEQFCREKGTSVVRHQYSMGNGAAIKTGARNSSAPILVFMDGDGQHKPEDIKKLIDKMDEGYDMVVGARSASSQASFARLCANTFYNWFASFMVGHKVKDLTSGFRAVRSDYFKKILYLLPNGFSYPTTSTMAFFRLGYSVGYVPIEAEKRIGKSHIHLFKDGYRFLLILFKIGTLYSPLKIFIPISFLFSGTGIGYYLYTFFTAGSLTNMTVLLMSTSVLIFLIGLVSEQITSLMYSNDREA